MLNIAIEYFQSLRLIILSNQFLTPDGIYSEIHNHFRNPSQIVA